MAQWMEDLKAVALEKGRGASAVAVARVGELPPALSALYRTMNGATLPGEVQLFALKALPEVGSRICFGRKGPDTRLFALRRAEVFDLTASGLIPAWVEAIEPEAWIYAATGGSDALQVYSTLERLFAVKVPPPKPAPEDFGDHTFARALETVREAIVALRQRKGASKPKAPPRARSASKPKARAKAGKTKRVSKPKRGR